MQSEMSLAPACAKDFWIDALSIIPDAKAELPFLISNFHFDVPRLRVPEGVSQGLSSNAVNFLSPDRMQTPTACLQPLRGRRERSSCFQGP